MRRWILNLAALAVVAGGSSQLLSAQTEIAPVNGICCTAGDGDKCCGSGGCSADASSCKAW